MLPIPYLHFCLFYLVHLVHLFGTNIPRALLHGNHFCSFQGTSFLLLLLLQMSFSTYLLPLFLQIHSIFLFFSILYSILIPYLQYTVFYSLFYSITFCTDKASSTGYRRDTGYHLPGYTYRAAPHTGKYLPAPHHELLLQLEETTSIILSQYSRCSAVHRAGHHHAATIIPCMPAAL